MCNVKWNGQQWGEQQELLSARTVDGFIPDTAGVSVCTKMWNGSFLYRFQNSELVRKFPYRFEEYPSGSRIIAWDHLYTHRKDKAGHSLEWTSLLSLLSREQQDTYKLKSLRRHQYLSSLITPSDQESCLIGIVVFDKTAQEWELSFISE